MTGILDGPEKEADLSQNPPQLGGPTNRVGLPFYLNIFFEQGRGRERDSMGPILMPLLCRQHAQGPEIREAGEVRRSKLDSLPIKDKVIQRLAAEENQAAIARDFGLHRSQVSRFARKEDIIPLVDAIRERFLLSTFPEAYEKVSKLLHMEKPTESEYKLQIEASTAIFELAGIFDSPKSQQGLSPGMRKILRKYSK